MKRRVRVRRFNIYREFNAIACHDVFFAQSYYYVSFRGCYDALVTSGDLRGDYTVTITFDGETMVIENDDEWVIALLKWSHV